MVLFFVRQISYRFYWFLTFFVLACHFGQGLINVAELHIGFEHKCLEFLVQFGISKSILAKRYKCTYNLNIY